MQIRSLRWYIAGLLFTATVINYIDRQTLSVLAPVLSKELDLSTREYAAIVEAFLAAYTVMHVASGFLVDCWGTRRSLAIFMAWWSAAGILHAAARNALQLGACRLLLGIGEPGNFTAAFRVVSEWFPPKERAFVNGLVNAGAAVGAVLAPPAVVWVALHVGWRAAFVLTGLLGFVWLATWLALYDAPSRSHRITAAERELIREAGAPPAGSGATSSSWRDLLRVKQTWALLLARFVSDPVWWFYLFWLPKYLADQRGFTIAQIGLLAWLPYLAADVGSIAGGLVSGRFVRRGWRPVRARLAVMIPCALVMPATALLGLTPSHALTFLLICLATLSHMGWRANLSTLTNDLYPTKVVGTVSGIVALGTGLGGTVFTELTGRIVEAFSYNAVFVMMGFLHPVALALVLALLRDTREESAM